MDSGVLISKVIDGRFPDYNKVIPKDNDKVLEIGTGSGYQTAVLVNLNADVYTIERQHLLFRKSMKKLSELGYSPKLIKYVDGYLGIPEQAPFDKILVTAAASEIPKKLLLQLKIEGKIVIPVGNIDQEMTLLVRKSETKFEKKKLGTAGPISKFKIVNNKPIIIINGDIYTRLNFLELINFHNKNNNALTVCSRFYNQQVPYGVISRQKQANEIIIEKPMYKHKISAGIYVINSKLVKDIPKNNFLNMNDFINSQYKKNYHLSEIFFEKKEKSINDTFKQIEESIKEIGFKNTANIYSISESAKFGGDLGWIEEKNLSDKLSLILKKLTVGSYTKPILIGNKFLILNLNEIKNDKIQVNEKEELIKMIEYEKNRQLEQFSKIYYDKVKINTLINEL